MRAIVLAGHGSLRPAAGAAMIRLAQRAHSAGLAPIVAAGFLNYRQPTFAEALARCAAEGATVVVVQPYFLVPGKYVHEDIARLLDAGRLAHPELSLRVAAPLGDHADLARLVLKRALEADYLAANPQVSRSGPRRLEDGAGWKPLYARHHTGLLIMAHGSPDPRSNAPIDGIARRIRSGGHYAEVTVCFLDLNHPSIPDAVDAMAAQGISHIIAAPYFLHVGRHVAEDLPALIDAAQQRNPGCAIILAEHLGYDRHLLAVIADRVAEATAGPPVDGLSQIRCQFGGRRTTEDDGYSDSVVRPPSDILGSNK